MKSPLLHRSLNLGKDMKFVARFFGSFRIGLFPVLRQLHGVLLPVWGMVLAGYLG